MTHTALTFSLTDKTTGRLAGMGLLCIEVRYASLLWAGARHIERAFVSPAAWNNIAHEVSVGLAPAPLDKTSAIERVLTRDRAMVVQWVSGLPVIVERPDETAAALDHLLRSMAVV